MGLLYLLKYHFVSIVIACTLFLLLFFTFSYTRNIEGIIITSWIEDKSSTSVTGPFFEKFSKDPFTVFLSTEIENSENLFNGSRKYLYIPQLYHSYIAVYVDGIKIGSNGFSEKRSGYFWNQPLLFELPDNFKKITLEISGLYRVGTDSGIYIIPSSELVKYRILSFLTEKAILMNIGMAFSIGIVLIIISLALSTTDKKIYFYLGMASILGSIWLFDLIGLSHVGRVFLLQYRKLTVSSAYFALSFLVLGFSHNYPSKKKIFDRIFLFINLIAGFSFWIAPDLVALESFIRSISIVLLLDVFYLLSKFVLIQSKVLLSTVLLFIMCVVSDAFVIALGIKGAKLISSYGITAMFFGFVYYLVNNYKEMLVRLTVTHAKSLTDSLTGAYNRGIFAEFNVDEKDVLVYLDVNRFKEINDTYGHEMGDMILKQLVQAIKNHTRRSDAVVRMGGDEFLLILKGCSVEKAREIAQKILSDFQKIHPCRPTFSYGISTFENTLNQTLKKVDSLMYMMKEESRANRKENNS